MNINLGKVGFSGRFRMVLSDDAEMQYITKDTGEFNNLIVDAGLHDLGDGTGTGFPTVCGRFVLGTGSTPPTVNDVALESPLKWAGGDVTTVTQTSSYAAGYYEITVKYQFGQSEAVGNLSEIGIQKTSVSGVLWSRALIRDENGTTTITKRNTDFLTCFYTLRINIPQQDQVFTNVPVLYDGVPTNTTVTVRPLGANSSDYSGGWGISKALVSTQQNTDYGYATSFYTGGLSAATSYTPLGSIVSRQFSAPLSVPAYDPINAPFEKHTRQKLGLTSWNSASLRTLKISHLLGTWQVNFDPPIQKDDTQEMTITVGVKWGRA